MFMDKALVKSRTLERPEAQPAIERMKKSSEEFNERNREVDARIEKLKKELKQEPNNQLIQDRLQHLYMLKALGKTLKNKVTQP